MTAQVNWTVWLVCSLSCALVQAQAGLSEETLTRLKAATVYLKVTAGQAEQSGSGFLLEKHAALGLIVTNAHVVRSKSAPVTKIVCVFHSGTRSELQLPATIAGADADRDLAVLTVRSDRLPEPLDAQTEVSVRETLPVFVLGFPFGKTLASGNRNPALTVSRGAVSSLRRDDRDQLTHLQIDGGIDTGNSGGPVVTETGALVGIAVAKLSNSQIGLAIPKQPLRELLQGRLASIAARPSERTSDHAVFDFQATLIDPRQNIRGVHILTIRKEQVPAPPQPQPDGSWQPVSPNMTSAACSVSKNEANGRVSLPVTPRKPGGYLYQVKLVYADGTTRFSAPAELAVETRPPAAKPGRPASGKPTPKATGPASGRS